MRVTVYTSPACVQCAGAKRYLSSRGIDHDTIDITTNPDAAETLRRSGFRSLPVIAIDGVPVIAGFAPAMIDTLVVQKIQDAA